MRFIDPDGNVVVDATGNPITYTAEKGWSPNATDDVKRTGNALMKTRTGTAQWNKMSNADHKISITLTNKTVKSNGGRTNGTTKPQAVRTSEGEIKFSKTKITAITLNLGSIKESTQNGSCKGLELDEALGVIAGHEAEHATNEKDLQEGYEAKQKLDDGIISKDEYNQIVEKDSEKVEEQIRQEVKITKKLSPIPFKGI